MAFSFAIADKAAAQQLPQTSISYSAEPANLVSINADGQIVVLSQPAAGLMTATIHGVEMSLVGADYVRTGYTGMTVLTLRFLTSCSVGGGCDAFGLDSPILSQRTRAFRDMSLATLSMFVASGADINELVGNQAGGYLLYRMASARNAAQFSLLVDAGADVNAAVGAFSILHYAVFAGDAYAVNLLLSADDIEVNQVLNGYTPLDRAAGSYLPDPAGLDFFLPIAATLRAAGGTCLHEDHVGNAAAAPICTGE